MLPIPFRSSLRATVSVHRERVQWIEPDAHGGRLVGSAPLESEALASIAAAALAARAAAGGRAREVVLALGPAWIEVRCLTLPALSAKERRAVLERKARSALGAKKTEVLFAARAEPTPERATASAEPALERWLLAAAERERIESLRDELRAAGLRVRAVVAARLASLPVETEAGVVLVVQRDPDGVAITLRAGAACLQQGALAPATGAALATALLQEARSHAAFARRTLRRDAVGALHLLGFEGEEGAAVEAQLTAGLGLPIGRREDGELALARALEAGAGRDGPGALDLASEPRLRPRRAALLSGAALLLALSLAAITGNELARQRDALGTELRELQRQIGAEERATNAAHGLPERIDALERAVELAEDQRDRGRAFGDRIAFAASAVRGEAQVESLELTPSLLRIEGRADERPLVGLAALERIRRRLAAQYAEIEVASPSDARGARFVLHARRAP